MAKVIKGTKQLAIIVSQKEYDLLAALVGMTTKGATGEYDWELWRTLSPHVVQKNKDRNTIACISKLGLGVEVLNRNQEEY